MPDASSNRYQSRLFNFVNQQSQRLGDRLQRTVRYLQVTTGWSLEALLYPVYVLFQKAIGSAGRQLHSEKQQPKLQLQTDDADSQPETPPSADTPIQRVLEVVDSLRVRGIASELVSRNLVLISNENEILNILTLQQQEKLQEQIIIEIAKYWRYWRLSAEKQETKLLTEINYLLTKLTSSGKDDKVPTLTENTRVATLIKSVSSLNPYPAMSLLDAAVAKLESNALVPMSRSTALVQRRASSLYHFVQTQLNIFIYGKEQPTKSTPRAVDAFDWENQAPNIQALIWAAVNFFFGDRTAEKVMQSASAKNFSEKLPGKRLPRRLASRTLPNTQDVADPWLSESDLFSESQFVSEPENQQQLVAAPQTKNPPLPSHQSPRSSKKNLIRESYQRLLRSPTPGAGLAQQTTPAHELSSPMKMNTSPIVQLESESNKGEISQQQRRQKTQMEAKPDWIETKAKTIGYEKHPLEQILEWLDRAILMLEEICVKIVQSLRRWL